MIRRHSTGETDNHHRFCGYDRANTGNSDKVPGPLDGKTTVADMHRLLQAAQIKPPYALLGKEPAIPVTYLLATPSGWTGPPAYEAVVLKYIAKYVDRFASRGPQGGGIPSLYGGGGARPHRPGAGEGHRRAVRRRDMRRSA